MPGKRVRIALLAVVVAVVAPAPGITLASATRSDPIGPGVAAASAIVPGSNNRASVSMRATYAVDASIAVSTGVVNVTTTIVARNDSTAAVDRIELNTIAARLGGTMTITSASVEGSPVTASVHDQTIWVPLGGLLPVGEEVTISVGYRATLRTGLAGPTGSSWLFTRYNGTLAMYRWIPWVSLGRPFDRPNHGDPFYTPSSPLVTINLTLDKAMVVAAPGASLPTAASKTWSFQVQNVRDVNIVMAPDFTVTTSSVDGITVRAYSKPGAGYSGTTLADRAKTALSKIADRLDVPYPWPSFTVVETAGGYGMESPSMVWIPSNTASSNLTYLMTHEVAHQWFYGMVGSDQQREPFADEAGADFVTRTVLGSLRGSRCAKDDLDRRITGYTSSCYYETIYIQGANKLNSLRTTMGSTAFWNALESYLESNKFQLGSTKELLETLRLASPVDLRPTLHARFPTLY